jgi:CheY-like chemotaxis protein
MIDKNKMVRILHADDEDLIYNVTSRILKPEGYELHRAHDGIEAVDFTRQMLREGGLSLVLMDMRMPRMGGLDAIKQIRQFSQIPILVISGRMTEDLVQDCVSLNCDYLFKPYKCAELVEKVKQNLTLPQIPGDGSATRDSSQHYSPAS